MKNIVILHHDNTQPHIACLTLETIENNACEVLLQPPYSPYLAPTDYHLFRVFEEQMRGQHYENNDTVHEAVYSWL
jgi:hypothetical protein